MTGRADDPLLRRLLGPADRQVGCDECFERLDEYVEIQLAGRDPARDAPAIAAHLDGCATCREEWQSLLAFLAAKEA